jgi:toxin ParE1/3/4
MVAAATLRHIEEADDRHERRSILERRDVCEASSATAWRSILWPILAGARKCEKRRSSSLWFDRERIGLGFEFWRSIDDMLAQIEENPLGFAKSEFATADVDFRFAIVHRFSYVVHFLIEIDEVQIVAVSHAAREPGYWLGRSKR